MQHTNKMGGDPVRTELYSACQEKIEVRVEICDR